MTTRRRAVASAVVALAAACGGEGNPVNPLSRSEATTSTDTHEGTGGGGGSRMDAGAPKRTIEMRNPFGSTKNNLLVDGDFELSVQSSPGGQVGWRAFRSTNGSEIGFKVETGGLCRTGLRCAVLESKMAFLGEGAAARDDAPHVATLWSKPPAGMPCDDVMTAAVVSCSLTGGQKKLTAQSELAGADGWCEYSASVPGRDSAPCIYVTSKLTGDAIALLDSATLEQSEPKSRRLEAWAPPPDFAASLDTTRDYIRRKRRFGRSQSPSRERPGP